MSRALLFAAALGMTSEAGSQPIPHPEGGAAGPDAPHAVPRPGDTELVAAIPGLAATRPPLRPGPTPGPVRGADPAAELLRTLIPGSPVSDAELARDAAASLPPPDPDGVLRQATTPPSRRPDGALGPLEVRDAVQSSGGIIVHRSRP